MLEKRLKTAIREVPDFPKPGISFKDITPILADPKLCRDIVDGFCIHFDAGAIDAIVGVESRGFLFGMMMAEKLGVPFIPVRKKGKLPYKTVSYKYDLEYGSAEVEMHVNTVREGMKVLIHDDLLATGGTAVAASELVRMQGGSVAGFAFVIELGFLGGIERLRPYSDNIVNLVSY